MPDVITKPEMDALTKSIAAELSKDATQRENAQLERLTKEFNDKLELAKTEIEKRHSQVTLPGSAEEKHNGKTYDLRKVLSAVVRNDWSDVAMERAMSDEIRRKTMTFSDAEAGGFFVPVEQSPEIIQRLYANSVVKQLGARVINLTSGTFTQTRISGGVTAGWGSEIATIAASQMTLDQMTLNPRRLAAVTPISDLLMLLQNGAALTSLEDDMAIAMALQLDLAALAGNGVPGAEPRGVLSAPVQTETLSDPGTYDQFLAFRAKVRGANALMGSLGWALSNADMLEIEQIKDKTQAPATAGDGDVNVQPLGSRSLLTGEGENAKILGYKALVSTQLTDGQVIFGNWNDMVIGQWGGVRFDRTNALGFLTGETHIRAVTYADIGFRHFESFVIPA